MKQIRKFEGKTDYKKRLSLVKSNKPRLVVRKSSRLISAQIIRYQPDGDETLVSATSKELSKLGYTGFKRNTPSAYLLGLLIAQKAKKLGLKDIVPDIGFHKPVKGSIIFSFLKGAKDGGLSVNLNESITPSEDRIKGSHINQEASKNFNAVKEKIIK